jgi:hypothetical protein
MNKARAWVELLGMILAAVIQVQGAITGKGMGSVKLAAVLAIIEIAAEEMAPVLGAFDAIKDRVVRIVERIVAALKVVEGNP